MSQIINKYITVFLMMVCCSAICAQNFMRTEVLEEQPNNRSVAFYQNDADDAFNVGIIVAGKKNIAFDLKLLFDNDFANDFETYSLRDFFVLDFNLVKSIGFFDIIFSIENGFNYGDNEVTNEPVLAQNNNSSYLTEFEHEAGFVAMLGVSYTF